MITEENDYIHDINELDKENIIVVQEDFAKYEIWLLTHRDTKE